MINRLDIATVKDTNAALVFTDVKATSVKGTTPTVKVTKLYQLLQLKRVHCNFTVAAFTSVAFTCVAFTSVAFTCVAFTCVAFTCVAFTSVAFTSVAFTSVPFTVLQMNNYEFETFLLQR